MTSIIRVFNPLPHIRLLKIYPPDLSKTEAILFVVFIDNKHYVFLLDEWDNWSDNDTNRDISIEMKELIYELIGLTYRNLPPR